MTTTRFRAQMQADSSALRTFLNGSHRLYPSPRQLGPDLWAHTTDTALYGIVRVEQGRFAFDGYVEELPAQEEMSE